MNGFVQKIGRRCAALAAAGASVGLLCAQPTNPPAPPPGAPPLREQLKNLTPEERRAKYLELRKSGAFGLTNQPANLPVTLEERRARIEEIRKQRGTNPPPTLDSLRTNRPADRLEELRRKKKDKTITPAEQQQLERAEAFLSRMQKSSATNGTLKVPPLALTNSMPAAGATNAPAQKGTP